MNNHVEYRRLGYRSPEPPMPTTHIPTSELAYHGDPSLAATSGAPRYGTADVAWVRPTELGTYATPMVGRGIDLHAELLRRARRAPVTTARSLQRTVPHAPTPTSPVEHTEGLQL